MNELEIKLLDPQTLPTHDLSERNIKELRHVLLQETDWWGTSDTTMTQAHADYRQALRDITEQPTYPQIVTWPTKPE